MTQNEIIMEELRIEEMADKLKRRQLGSIRFIGELFKKGLATLPVMISCFDNLMCDETNHWKGTIEDIHLEALCKLMRTVGAEVDRQLSIKAPEKRTRFETYFERIKELSQDKKKLNSRMRFALEEVLELRKNEWIERRQEEGPVKLEVIHRKVDEEFRKSGILLGSKGATSRGDGYSQKVHQRGSPVDYRGRHPPDHAPPTGRRPDVLPRGQQYSSVEPPSAKLYTPDRAEPRLLRRSSIDEEKVAKMSLEDYITTSSVQDLLDSLKTLSCVGMTSFVIAALTKLTAVSNPDIRDQILHMICCVDTLLLPFNSAIWHAITQFEQLKLLADTAVDIKNVRLHCSYLYFLTMISGSRALRTISRTTHLDSCIGTESSD